MINKKRLIKLIKDNPNITYNELASYFNCTRQAVQNYCKRHGIKKKDNKISMKDIIDLYEKSGPIHIESAMYSFNVSKNGLIRFCKRNGIEYETSIDIKIKDLKRFYKENPGISINQLKQIFKSDYKFIKKYITETS